MAVAYVLQRCCTIQYHGTMPSVEPWARSTTWGKRAGRAFQRMVKAAPTPVIGDHQKCCPVPRCGFENRGAFLAV
eukprot:3662005-Prymnesium_polylepis.1